MTPAPKRPSFIILSITLFLMVGVSLVAFAAFPNATNQVAVSPAEQQLQAALHVPSALPTGVTPLPHPATPLTPIPTMPGGPPTPWSDTPVVGSPLPTITPLPPDWINPEFGLTPTALTVRPTPLPTHLPGDPLNATLFVERVVNIRGSTILAELIVIGTVRQVGPSRWSTPDGRRPANPWAEDNNDFIFTPITVTVESYIKGLRPETELYLHGYGGTVGQDSQRWGGDDLYDFSVGDRVVLFLFRSERQRVDPPAVRSLNLWAVHNRFSITQDGQALNSFNRLPLDQLLAEIRAVLAEPPPTSTIP